MKEGGWVHGGVNCGGVFAGVFAYNCQDTLEKLAEDWWREERDALANPPGCRGANSVRSQTPSPITTQRSLVLLCCSTSSAVNMRVMVGFVAAVNPTAPVKLVVKRGRRKVELHIAAQF